MTRAETWQDIFHRYEAANMPIPAKARDVADWAVAQGLAAPHPAMDPMDQLADECARALREEYEMDSKGRRYRVNHAVRRESCGSQMTFWADIRTAPREHMVGAFAQRRKQIVGDCHQLKTDVDCFNILRPSEEPIQMVIDFAKDVQEIEAMELEGLEEISSIAPRPQVAQFENVVHP